MALLTAWWFSVILVTKSEIPSTLGVKPYPPPKPIPWTNYTIVNTGFLLNSNFLGRYANGILLQSFNFTDPSNLVSNRVKRSLNGEDLNPLAWIGKGIASLFGFATTFDIEDLEVQSHGVSSSLKALRQINSLQDHRVTEVINVLQHIVNDSLPEMARTLSKATKHYNSLVHAVRYLSASQSFYSTFIMARAGFLHPRTFTADRIQSILNNLTILNEPILK